ncbi:MAG: aldehyde dehydrogenase family protein, partial [Methylococcales bacterium]|nr:aldehyde dehydrogenase family protein [Methylococcales bacterium]
MIYEAPNQPSSKFSFKSQYENFIGGEWVSPVDGLYIDNISPVDGKVFCKIPQSNAKDIDLALDAAHAAKDAWGKKSVTDRSNILLKIAD